MKPHKNQFLASPSPLGGCVCCAAASSPFRAAEIFAAHVKMLGSPFGFEIRMKNTGERRGRENINVKQEDP